ncbi:hypothetical protein BGX27_009760 [Mortierella sp. AM989]|nr:hypothetical protein BGX27_009760 [Mortierella sp. AM989]
MQLTHIHVSILSPEILIITQQNTDTLTSFSCRSNRLRKDQEAQGLWCRQLFFILEMVPNLTEFALGPVILLDPPNQEFNKICKNLKTLELDRIKVSLPSLYSDSVTAEAESVIMESFPRLESLALIWNDFPPQCQLELIRKSPNLKSLIWRRGTKLLAESWLSGTLAVPQELSMLDIGNSHLEDEDMGRLLALIPSLTALNARSTPFSSNSLAQLVNNQGPDMVELELMECTSLTSEQIQTILTSMPKLKRFSASLLEASDFFISNGNTGLEAVDGLGSSVAQGASAGPWVCLGLEELEISIIGPEVCEETDLARYASAVYDQLGKLRQLRVLSLKEITSDYRDHGPLLDLTLENGLGFLSSLKYLRELNIRGISAKMDKAEVEWIAREWTRLIAIKGPLNSVPGVNAKDLNHQLKRLLPAAVVL